MALNPSNVAGQLIHTGRNPIAKSVTIAGHVEGIDTATPPVLIWDAKTNYVFPTSAVSLELVSTSTSDAAAGTGAQIVLVTTIDANGDELIQTVVTNGTTSVALTGTHIAVNFVQLAQAGSNNSNVGNIIVREVGGGATHGFILAGIGAQRAFRYMVPRNRILILDGFYINPNDTNGASKVIAVDFNIRLNNGVVLQRQRNFHKSLDEPFNLTLPTGYGFPGTTTVYAMISSTTANGANFAVTVSGSLFHA